MDMFSKIMYTVESWVKAPIIAIMAFLLTLFPNWGGLQFQYQSMTFEKYVITDNIMDAIETRNIDALEAMMCLNIKQNVTDLRGEIGALIDAIDGKVTEYDWKIEGGGYSGSRSGKRIVQDNWGIYFKTPVKNYRLLVYWEVANNFSPGETGIRRIRLVSETDDVLLNLISATEGVNDWHD